MNITATVDREALKEAIREVIGEMMGNDRREVPRPMAAKGTKRPTKTCPMPGCRNPFAPRFFGYCKNHRDTAAFKKAAAASKAKKRKR